MIVAVQAARSGFDQDRASAVPHAPFVRVFGYAIENTTLHLAARFIADRAQAMVSTNIAFLNAHCINVAQTDPDYATATRSMDRLYGDGIGIRLAARAAGVTLADNVNGTDLFPILCSVAAERGLGVFLFGARPEIAAQAGRAMQARLPDLKIAGTAHGYVSTAEAETALIDRINASGARILFVALGVPQQELWIARNRHRLTVPVIIGVGGLFDYFSGRIARAPAWVRRWHGEWVWRLAMEPRRLAQRYLIGNATFLARLAWQRLAVPQAFRPLSAREIVIK